MASFIQQSKDFVKFFSLFDFSDLDNIKQNNKPSINNELISFNDVDLDNLMNTLILPHVNHPIDEKQIFCLNDPNEESFFYTMNSLYSHTFEKKIFQNLFQTKLQYLQNIFKIIIKEQIFEHLSYKNEKHVLILYRLLRTLDYIDEDTFYAILTITKILIDFYITNKLDSMFIKICDLIDNDTKNLIENVIQSKTFLEATCSVTQKILKNLNLTDQEIKTQFQIIKNNLFDSIYISLIDLEPHTIAETFGKKWILFGSTYFKELAVNKSKNKLTKPIISKFLISLIHEIEHFLIRYLIENINMYQQSPQSTLNIDSGIKLENALFGSKVTKLGFNDTEFLNDLKNWSLNLKAFKTQFKDAIKKSKNNYKKNPKNLKFMTYLVGRYYLKFFSCGTNLTAIHRKMRLQEKILNNLREKKGIIL